MENIIINAINRHKESIKFVEENIAILNDISLKCIETIKNKGKIIFMGNGGSAADAQHLAAEFIGRFKKKRQPLPAIALSSNIPVITAIGNDFGYEEIFSYQIEALAQIKDLVFAISTSGKSKNLIKGILKAKDKGTYTIGLLGKDGGELKNLVDTSLIIPIEDTARIQEMHILIGHIICQIVEEKLFQ
ncbi:MAG: D-sedoheptulose 7-phosphate isomerase [Candidatus Omnitrophica bacterium]|nr:D-sedoheptulose 7-phosphate isomerase [Candidatus Omnitrophota bacterium]